MVNDSLTQEDYYTPAPLMTMLLHQFHGAPMVNILLLEHLAC